MKTMITRLVIGSFVVELVLAEAWLRLAEGSSLSAILLETTNLGVALAAGLILAVVVAEASRYYFHRFAADIVRDFFEPLFKGLGWREVLLLSLLPGIGEEALFRGVIQPAAGIVPATIIFGLLHSGFSRRLLPYGLWTTAVGGLLGLLYLWSGNLWGSIVAHAVINASGTLWMRGSHNKPEV